MKVTIFLVLLFGAVGVNAQTYKFGDVPIDQLLMEVYDKDSTASAVVLFSNGESELEYYNDRFHLIISRHVRIKILTNAGLDEGDIEIRFRNKKSDTPQDISKIKASSYFLDENGKVKEESVGRRDRFEEEISEYIDAIKFTIPNLKKGSVLEYSYEVSSYNPLDFPDWIFQSDIPIIWTEYKARVPEWFGFLTVTRGYQNFLVNERSTYNDKLTIRESPRRELNAQNVLVSTPAQVSTFDYEGTNYHYVMEHVPAIKDEPYMKASIDYLAQLRFQLSWIKLPGSLTTNYLTTWPGLVNNLLDDGDFGKRLKSSSLLTKVQEEATEGIEGSLDKMIAIYNHVSKTMDWDEKYGLYAFKNLNDIYEEGTGNGTSINLILVQMLREAGFEAHPVVVSTRFNGEIVNLFPLVGQFNHTIAYVQFDNNYYLLDAKSEDRPYNLLPSQVLNDKGLLVYKDRETWIPLQNRISNSSVSVINVVLSDDGYTGSLQSQKKGFYAYDIRNKLDFTDLDKSIYETIFREMDGFIIDSSSIKKDKLDESFDYTAHFSFKEELPSDVMYFNPMITESLTENPFKLEKRTFPIDYDYPFGKNIIMNITIPEGWVVDESPKSVLFKLPEQSGEFRRIIQVNGRIISMNYLFKINKTRFMPDEYEGVRQFYDQMVEMLAENIVLKKEY